MRYQSSRSGDNDVGSKAHALHLLVVTVAVVATVHGHARHVGQVIRKALHRLVYLLGKLTRRRHHYAVDNILGIVATVKLGEDGQQIRGRLSRSSLGHAHDVVAIQDRRYTLFLHRGAFIKTHVVKSVENVVGEI